MSVDKFTSEGRQGHTITLGNVQLIPNVLLFNRHLIKIKQGCIYKSWNYSLQQGMTKMLFNKPMAEHIYTTLS